MKQSNDKPDSEQLGRTVLMNGDGADSGITNTKNIFWLVFTIGLLLRSYICFGTSLPNFHRDTYEYFKQAEAILKGGYINFFPNGYPMIIAFSQKLFGGAGLYFLLILNIIFSTSCIYFTYSIAYKVSKSDLAALVAASILAVFPSQINYVRWLTTETPTVFFLLAGIYCYFNSRKTQSGLLLGIATVIRTEMIFILLLVILIDLIHFRRINFRLILGSFLPIFALGALCYVKTGSFSLAGYGRVNILTSVTARGSYIDWDYATSHSEVKSSKDAMHLYLQQAKNHPSEFIQNRFLNVWELWGFYASSAEESRSVLSRLVIGICNFFMVVFGFYGFYFYRKKYEVVLLILPFIVVTLVHTVFFAMQRYTCPVEPFMIILGIIGFFRLPFLRHLIGAKV